ncbi:MAG: pyridoxal phosphate-dependent aminotransferase [Clostridiales bacterium]|jgi:cystathionine beta-lyase|nr:pyridoxal phosphate-dependent aminotransferase [Clostridiales bacterium]
MSFDFDRIIDRRNTNSLKYDYAAERGRPKDIQPLWVADMDFAVPAEITAAIQKTAAHGVFGYSVPSPEYFQILSDSLFKRFSWRPQPEWLCNTPGVVYALAMAVKAFTRENESVIIQQPVYYPFRTVITSNNRRLINSPLVRADGGYIIDFSDFEKKITDNGVKLFILCSPHNPVGRVWTRGELTRLGEICLKHNVIVVSDEIHSDFVYPGNKHYTFHTLDDRFLNNTVLCTSPGKSFNLAGLQFSDILIPNGDLRKRFTAECDKCGYDQLNIFGIVAAEAAYRYGEPWLAALVAYLEKNADFIAGYLKQNLPQIKYQKPEGTYLAWLDFSALRLSQKELDRLITYKAGLWLDSGLIFGAEGAGFQRINFACPRSVLKEALDKLTKALS